MKRWAVSGRYIPDEIDRAKLRTTIHYRFHPRIQVGLEWNPLAEEFAPLANIHLLSESTYTPAVIFNTSTDRIGTPDGQSFTLTLSKDLQQQFGSPVAPYVGVAYGTYEDKARIIGGIYMRYTDGWSSTILFDGVKVHPLLTYSYDQHSLSMIFVKLKTFGVSYSFAF
jgi:hypothetical protein